MTTPLLKGKRGTFTAICQEVIENCQQAEATEEAVALLADYLIAITGELLELLEEA